MTMAAAIRRYLEAKQGPATASEIRSHIDRDYPSQWKSSTLSAHLYACVVNNPKSYIHHPSADRFLYKSDDGLFRIYSEETHGPNVWEPVDDSDDVLAAVDAARSIEDLVETSISLERDVEEHLIRNLESIENGLRFVGRQVSVEVGRVDILAEDSRGRRVVIELKVGEANDSAVGQIARYLGWYARQDGKAPRGLLIASDFPDRVRYAAEAVTGLALLRYRVQFAFDSAGLGTV